MSKWVVWIIWWPKQHKPHRKWLFHIWHRKKKTRETRTWQWSASNGILKIHLSLPCYQSFCAPYRHGYLERKDCDVKCGIWLWIPEWELRIKDLHLHLVISVSISISAVRSWKGTWKRGSSLEGENLRIKLCLHCIMNKIIFIWI